MNKELYDKVIEAYKSGDENYFNASARNWVQEAESAPFENAEARELFSQAKRHCSIWHSKGISYRVSKVRMLNCIKEIAKMDLPNPYEEKKEVKEHKHILGIIPEEKIPEFAKEEIVKKDEAQIKEEKTPDDGKKKIFNRHKKR